MPESKQNIAPQYGPETPNEKDKIREQIEVEKLRKELEAQRLGFKDFAEFTAKNYALGQKEAELLKREETIQTREELVAKREADVVLGGERNEAVKQNLINHEIQDFKRAKAVRDYAFINYYTTWDLLLQKLYNCKQGKNTIGQVKRGTKMVDETVVMDADFFEEIKPLISTIQTVLKKAPRFKTETQEYMTDDEETLEDEQESPDG